MNYLHHTYTMVALSCAYTYMQLSYYYCMALTIFRVYIMLTVSPDKRLLSQYYTLKQLESCLNKEFKKDLI